MSLATIERLVEMARDFARALDSSDVAAIEAAAVNFQDAAAAVQSAGGWRETPELKMRVTQALAEVDAARLRCAYYGDTTRRKLDALAALGADLPAAIAYDRSGRR